IETGARRGRGCVFLSSVELAGRSACIARFARGGNRSCSRDATALPAMQKQPTELQWGGPVLVLNDHSDVRTEPELWAQDLIIRSHAPERPRRKERLEKLCQMISPTGVRRIEAESACLSPMKFSTGPTNSMYRRNGFRKR